MSHLDSLFFYESDNLMREWDTITDTSHAEKLSSLFPQEWCDCCIIDGNYIFRNIWNQQIELNLLQLLSCRYKKTSILGSTASSKRIRKTGARSNRSEKHNSTHLSGSADIRGVTPMWVAPAHKLTMGHFPQNSAAFLHTGALCTFWRSPSDEALKKACVLSLGQEVRKVQCILDKPSDRDRKRKSSKVNERPKKARVSLVYLRINRQTGHNRHTGAQSHLSTIWPFNERTLPDA